MGRPPCLTTALSHLRPVKPVIAALGAFLLVLGGALIAFASFYVSTGFINAELGSAQSFNSTMGVSTLLSKYSGIASTAELVSLAGVVLAPLGGAVLAYGVTQGKSEEKAERSPVSVP